MVSYLAYNKTMPRYKTWLKEKFLTHQGGGGVLVYKTRILKIKVVHRGLH